MFYSSQSQKKKENCLKIPVFNIPKLEKKIKTMTSKKPKIYIYIT